MSSEKASRRKVLKSVGGGFGITATAEFGSLSTRKVRITTVRSGDEPLEQKKVSKKWWQQMERATEAQKRLQKQYQKSPGNGVKDVSLSTRAKLIGGRKAGAVNVYVDPDVGAQVSLPDHVDGIEINQKEYTERELQADDECQYDDCDQSPYEEEHSYVPGGVKSERELDSGAYAVGTTTCRVYDSDDKYYLMHCAHQFGACDGDTSTRGMEALHAYQKTGEVANYDIEQDFAVVEETWDTEVEDYDDTVENAAGKVKGRVTESGVKDLMGNETDIYKCGQRTCRTSGVVADMYQSNSLGCAVDDDDYVHVTMETCQGDSGAPYFAEKWDSFSKTEYTAIIGVHSRGGAYGCAAYKINDKWGFYFG